MNFQRSPKTPRDPLNRAFYLPRLAREHYQADAVVFWILTIFDKAKGWLTPAFHRCFRELMFHAAAREGLLCPLYCLMPDHLHLVWMGLRPDSDQFTGMAFLRTYLEPELSPAKFQPQAQDEVLREEQRKRNAFAKVCFYIAANPVRAGLINLKEIWPFTGCVVPGYPKLNTTDDDFWPVFWRIDSKLRQPDAGNVKRPPIVSNEIRDSSRRLLQS
jgi:putative transposase